MGVEKDIFVELVSKYALVIENKKPNAASLNLKAQRWEKFSREHNNDGWKNCGKTSKVNEEMRDVFTTAENILWPSQYFKIWIRCNLTILQNVKQNWILCICAMGSFGTLQLILDYCDELSYVMPIFLNRGSQLLYFLFRIQLLPNIQPSWTDLGQLATTSKNWSWGPVTAHKRAYNRFKLYTDELA